MSENANLKRSAYLHTRMPWVHFWGQKSSEHFRKHMDQGRRANLWKTQVDGHKSTQENDWVYSEYTRIYVKYDLKIKLYLYIYLQPQIPTVFQVT